MKVAVVGGGSTYTPEPVEGFARLLPEADIQLVDPAAGRLAVVGPFARRLNPRVTSTTDPDEGLDGADIVVIQLRVGGQRARIHDETFPQACGCVGQETTGAGGLAKAVRTVPVVLDVAEQAARRAEPGAWIVNFTTRSASSPAPCSTPATARSGCATWRSGSSAASPSCSAYHPRRSTWTTWGSITSRGNAPPMWTVWTAFSGPHAPRRPDRVIARLRRKPGLTAGAFSPRLAW